jgi:formate-dependent nitrite reductase membrane component NrfD
VSAAVRHPTPSPDSAPARTRRGRQTNVSAYPSRGIVKPAPWKWYIPAYFFLGGIAGTAATLSLGASLAGNRRLASRARIVAMAAFVPCAPLLIVDLGRPARFYNMLRVFRPTSPMNVGTWLVTAFGASISAAVVGGMLRIFAPFRRLGTLAAGLLGPLLSTYTAVLVSNTSTPVWHEACRSLPFLFAAGATASGAAATCMLTPVEDAGPARRLAVAGGIAEVAASRVMKARLGALASSYEDGRTASFTKAAEGASVAGSVLLLALGRRRIAAIAGSALVLAGTFAARLAVWQAGLDSASRT